MLLIDYLRKSELVTAAILNDLFAIKLIVPVKMIFNNVVEF